MRSVTLAVALTACLAYASPVIQAPLSVDVRPTNQYSNAPDRQDCVPRIYYASDEDDLGSVEPPNDMKLTKLHVPGEWKDRVDLTFFSDGYTEEEEWKFIKNSKKLTADIVSPGGAMAHVAHLLNVYAIFVPSNESGIGNHDKPINSSYFGLYRPGPELRAVFVKHPQRARAACDYWRNEGRHGRIGGCDQPILLGNDPLYGGLGGEFTIITASELNGPLVLRHELGHSLIEVGEEYEGGYVYSGVNSDKMKHLSDLKWKDQLTRPDQIRIEDVKVPLQEYPWYDLSSGSYSHIFNSSTTAKGAYPSALMRMSLSSIPYPDSVNVRLNGQSLNIATSFPGGEWEGSKDRRWVEVELPSGIKAGRNQIHVSLTEKGRKEAAGQGGKMITSVEIIEYGLEDRCDRTEGFIGAFPTYAMDGGVTLRPTNEGCLMRKVNHPSFCEVCARGLEANLLKRISKKQRS